MRELKPGSFARVTEVGEVFKYIASSKRQYTLIALCSPNNICKGCVFLESGGHPLGAVKCNKSGLRCYHRIFKQVDTILEDL